MIRAAFFALVGGAWFVHWTLTDPTHAGSKSASDWNFVLGFSAALLLLAIAVPLLAQLARRPSVFKVSLVPAASLGLASVSNVFEDGFGMDWMFFVFILMTGVTLLGLLALGGMIALGDHGARRLLAFIPLGTVVAMLLYVVAGGIVMLTTWLVAGALSLVWRGRLAVQAGPA
jgi:hypothetical protein